MKQKRDPWRFYIMTDIVENLKQKWEWCDFVGIDTLNEERKQAAEIIESLRAALHSIGYDYVELSHDKVQWLYLEHMKIAKEAYINSFPPEPENKPDDIRPFDDNF